MDMTALLLSRIQFAFTITFHIIFPSFTIGLAAWLTVLEALVSRDRSPGLSRDLRILAEDIRRGVWIGRGVRHRDGVPVRHELERAVQNVRADPGTASDVRDLHRLHARGRLLRCSHLWPQPRAAVVLSVFDRDGGAGDHVFGVLDHGQQQLDAGADRLCPGKWRLRSQRLEQRSSSIRWSGRDFRTCCSPLT